MSHTWTQSLLLFSDRFLDYSDRFLNYSFLGGHISNSFVEQETRSPRHSWLRDNLKRWWWELLVSIAEGSC